MKTYEFNDVVVNGATFLHGFHDGRKIIIGQHHGGGFPGNIGTAETHCHPYIGSFECRRIVYTVTGHRGHMTTRLECKHNTHFLFRRGTGENTHVINPGGQLGITHGVEFGIGHNRSNNTQFTGDRGGRNFLVTCDHLDRDAGLIAQCDGIPGFRSGWIHQPNKPGKYEIFHIDEQVTVWHEIPYRQFSTGDGQYPQTGIRHLLVDIFNSLFLLSIQWLIAVFVIYRLAIGQ